MKKSTIIKILILAGFFLSPATSFGFTEPSNSQYSCQPIFMSQSVKPNILIILDNSGSMNFAAYGTWAGDYGAEITDSPYTGSIPYCGATNIKVINYRDDSEERTTDNASWVDSWDLDLGRYDNYHPTIVGVRFQNVKIPPGATITKAYIQFTASAYTSTATSLTIKGELTDNSDQFEGYWGKFAYQDISGRPTTSSSVSWNNIPAWSRYSTYKTPDLSGIVQEIVNRQGWASGNAMAFIFSGTGKRDAYAYDGSSSRAPLLHVEYTPAKCTRYYGYFDPDAHYSYSGNKFVRDPNGPWYGNWLNWLSMRRIDIARKVLVGGLATSRTGGGNTTLIGDNHNQQPGRYWKRQFDSSQSGVSLTPYNGNYWYGIKGGYIYVDNDSNPFSGYIARYNIKVQKNESEEPDDFLDGKIAGVLQRVGNKARWGLEFYNTSAGGKIYVNVKDGSLTNMVTNIENKEANTWTPLAEAFYEGVRYFKQTSPYYYNGDFQRNNNADPYYWQSENDFVSCSKSFVILITDGESTQDLSIPSDLRDYDGDGNDPGSYSSNGSDYLDDVALWAHVNDLRSDLDGTQNITLYTVFAFGAGSSLLQDAAKNGGFIDKNGNNRPDLDKEWDIDENGVPDTYYESPDGYELETKLLAAITDILKRAASGTAVSVLATSGEGEGNLVQAFFRPQVTSGLTEIKWLGYLQSLWVDSLGNLREDTNGNRALDITGDKVITYFVDPSSGNTKVKRFAVSASDPYPDVENDPYETMELDKIKAIWQAGKLLAERSAADRKIFTYLDKDNDGVVDESADDPFDDSGEVVRFHTGSAAEIKPYLGVQDDSTWEYLAGTLTNTHDNRVTNLIQYIRGNDISGLRTRTFDYDADGTDETWKLGDIIHSTPVSTSKPPDNFHIIYSDKSYQDFFNAFKNRETVVYVGANDGMLHAFTSWKFDSASMAYTDPYPTDGPGDSTYIPGEVIGDELWAYIPQSLLPHLKWLPATNYAHVYYVDMKPKVFDAKILPDDTHYSDSDTEKNWGTFLLVGFNLGGGYIQAKEDFDYDGNNNDSGSLRGFYPSYVCLDVTEPRNPRLMWERSYADLQASASTPAVVKVKDKWFAVFGSGPSGCSGESAQTGKIYVVDLETGDPYQSGGNDWLFETAESNAFMNSPVSLDKELNYNVDAIYIGETYLQGSSDWKGKVYKITIPWADSSSNYDGTNLANYSDNPNDTTNPWQFSELFDATRPVTAPLALSVDYQNNAWIYGGTGRYLNDTDKSNTDTQYFFGIKDPFFNSKYETTSPVYYHNYSNTLTLSHSDLLENVQDIVVTDTGNVYKNDVPYPPGTSGTFNDLLTAARAADGWIREMTGGERMLTKPSLLGGIVFAPSFVPNSDICGFSGDSYLYGVYFETGTAYYKPAFNNNQTITVTINGDTHEQVVDKISLGAGKASSLGIHVGAEEGAKGFIQQSTGSIISESLTPALKIKSGLRSWQEK